MCTGALITTRSKLLYRYNSTTKNDHIIEENGSEGFIYATYIYLLYYHP